MGGRGRIGGKDRDFAVFDLNFNSPSLPHPIFFPKLAVKPHADTAGL